MVSKRTYDREGHAHFVTFSCFRRRRLLDDDLTHSYAPSLDQQRQAQKATSREDFGKNVLADTSAAALTVPLDLADGSQLMNLV
jgi:hypothetical protein